MEEGEILAVIIASLMIGGFFGGWYATSSYQDKAATTECARFHPETGKFEWIKEPDQ